MARSISAVNHSNASDGVGAGGFSLWNSMPLLTFGLALYALVDALARHAPQPWYLTELLSIRQMSGDLWHINASDLFLALSIALLFVELVRATRTSGSSILNHALSALVFVGALVLFVTQEGYGNSTFFLFTALTLVDFMAGFIITTVAARRDVTISH